MISRRKHDWLLLAVLVCLSGCFTTKDEAPAGVTPLSVGGDGEPTHGGDISHLVCREPGAGDKIRVELARSGNLYRITLLDPATEAHATTPFTFNKEPKLESGTMTFVAGESFDSARPYQFMMVIEMSSVPSEKNEGIPATVKFVTNVPGIREADLVCTIPLGGLPQ